jgi:HSP20 family protein
MAKKPKSVPVKKEAPAEGHPSWPALDELVPWRSLREEIDRVFEGFAKGWPSLLRPEPFRWPAETLARAGFEMSPVVDLSETDKAYEIKAELPGMDEKDVTLTLRDDVLTLKGEKKSEREEKKEDYYLSERRFGSFRRSFRLPDDANADKIQASYAKGVMSITVPKSASTKKKERKISVKSG